MLAGTTVYAEQLEQDVMQLPADSRCQSEHGRKLTLQNPVSATVTCDGDNIVSAEVMIVTPMTDGVSGIVFSLALQLTPLGVYRCP
ncbi:MAG TPA: hypothetical protein VKP88_08635 [Candidatus Paceibacterota bacterium]|nr:hypothetical protein [Candidatus Paceibacterota bacterium]